MLDIGENCIAADMQKNGFREFWWVSYVPSSALVTGHIFLICRRGITSSTCPLCLAHSGKRDCLPQVLQRVILQRPEQQCAVHQGQ